MPQWFGALGDRTFTGDGDLIYYLGDPVNIDGIPMEVGVFPDRPWDSTFIRFDKQNNQIYIRAEDVTEEKIDDWPVTIVA